MIKEVERESKSYTVLRWLGGFDELQEVGQKLGTLGYIFEVRTPGHPLDQQANVYPELHIYDNRYRSHVATHGTYIIVGPGHRNIRVLDRMNYRAEFE